VKKQSSRHPVTTSHSDSTPLRELSRLQFRLPSSLLRSIRLQAALNAMTLNDFVREAIEERLHG